MELGSRDGLTTPVILLLNDSWMPTAVLDHTSRLRYMCVAVCRMSTSTTAMLASLIKTVNQIGGFEKGYILNPLVSLLQSCAEI